MLARAACVGVAGRARMCGRTPRPALQGRSLAHSLKARLGAGGQALAREQARRKREGAPAAAVAQAERDWVGLLADAVRARRPLGPRCKVRPRGGAAPAGAHRQAARARRPGSAPRAPAGGGYA